MTRLEQVLQHVRLRNRPNSHDAVLLAEIDRLRATIAALQGTQDASPDPFGLDKLTQEVTAVRDRARALRDRVCGATDDCCHKTRLAGAGCPIGRECPYA